DAFAAQQIAAVRIDERQGIALVAIARAKPALEVDAPNGVGALARAKRLRQRHHAPSSSARDCKTAALEDAGDTARARPHATRVAVDEPRTKFARPPARSLLARSDDVLLDVDGHGPWIAVRPSRPVLERTHVVAGLPIAGDPEITGRSAHTEHAAQLRDIDA